MAGKRAAWTQVAAGLLILAVDAVLVTTWSVQAVPLAREFHPSRMVLMLTMTVMAAVSALLSPVLGLLMDRWPLRRLAGVGLALLAAGYVAVSMAQSFGQVMAVYGLLMAPANVLLGPIFVVVLVTRWFEERRGAALGVAMSGLAIGGFVFPPVVQALLDASDWRTAFRMLALLVVVAGLPALVLIRERPAAIASADAGRRAAGGAPSTRTILLDPAFWCAAAVFAVVLSGIKGMVTNLVPMALDEGVAAADAALLISFYAACGLASKLGFAAVADRFNLSHLLFGSLFGFAAGMACLSRAGAGYAVIGLGVGLVGLSGSLMVPLQGLLVPRLYGPAVVGKASGLLNLVILAALLATPPLFGFVFDRTGSYDAVFLVFAGLAAAAMVLVPGMRAHRRAAVPLPA